MKTCVLLLGLLSACTRSLDLSEATGALPDGSSPLSSLDDTCSSSSYTGHQLLSLLQPTYAVYYAPTDPNDLDTESAWNAAHQTPLTITAAWAGGVVGCAPPHSECPPGPGCFLTEPTLSVALALGFATADGTFDEHLTATATWLPIGPPAENQNQTIQWEAVIPATSVHGSYQVWSGAGALGPASQVSLDFRGTFSGNSASDSSVGGEVDEEIATGNGSVESGGDGGGQFGANL